MFVCTSSSQLWSTQVAYLLPVWRPYLSISLFASKRFAHHCFCCFWHLSLPVADVNTLSAPETVGTAKDSASIDTRKIAPISLPFQSSPRIVQVYLICPLINMDQNYEKKDVESGSTQVEPVLLPMDAHQQHTNTSFKRGLKSRHIQLLSIGGYVYQHPLKSIYLYRE